MRMLTTPWLRAPNAPAVDEPEIIGRYARHVDCTISKRPASSLRSSFGVSGPRRQHLPP